MSNVLDLKRAAQETDDKFAENYEANISKQLAAITVTDETRERLKAMSHEQVDMVETDIDGNVVARDSVESVVNNIASFRGKLSKRIAVSESQIKRSINDPSAKTTEEILQEAEDVNLITPGFDKYIEDVKSNIQQAKTNDVIERAKHRGRSEADMPTLDALNACIAETVEVVKGLIKSEEITEAALGRFFYKGNGGVRNPMTYVDKFPMSFMENYMPHFIKDGKYTIYNYIKFTEELLITLKLLIDASVGYDALLNYIEEQTSAMNILQELAALSFNFSELITCADPALLISNFIKENTQIKISNNKGTFSIIDADGEVKEIRYEEDKLKKALVNKCIAFYELEKAFTSYRDDNLERFAEGTVARQLIDEEIKSCHDTFTAVQNVNNWDEFFNPLRGYIGHKLSPKDVQKSAVLGFELAKKLPYRVSFPGVVAKVERMTLPTLADNCGKLLMNAFIVHNKIVESDSYTGDFKVLELDEFKDDPNFIMGLGFALHIAIGRYLNSRKDLADPVKSVEIVTRFDAICSMIGDLELTNIMYKELMVAMNRFSEII